MDAYIGDNHCTASSLTIPAANTWYYLVGTRTASRALTYYLDRAQAATVGHGGST